MEHLDYYTVMESRIKYFARKYDPQNKFGDSANANIRIIKTPVVNTGNNKSVEKKISKKLDYVISIFL
jgi:hypothetical protein